MNPIHSIKGKLTILLVGTMALILLLATLLLGNMVSRLYQEEASRNFERVFVELGLQLRDAESTLAEQLHRLSMRDDVIASINMLARYSRADAYQPLIFDTEKRILLAELSKDVEAGSADEILAYDAEGQLLGFVRPLLSGHLSYEQSRAHYLLSDDAAVQRWQEHPLPDGLSRQLGPALMQERQQRSLRLDESGLQIQSSVPIFRHYPDGSRTTVGYLVSRRVLDERFVERFSLLSGISNTLLFSSGLRLGELRIAQGELADVVQISNFAGKLPYTRLEYPDYHLAALRIRMDDGAYAHWVAAMPTESLQQAIADARRLILLILLLVAATILPLALWLTHRMVSRPLQALNEAADTLKRGDYNVQLPAHGNDELASLSSAFNDMSSAIQQRESELRDSRSRYQTLVDTLPQRIYYKDKELRYLSCNSSYARDLGLEQEQVIGKSDFDLLPEAIAREMQVNDKRVMQAREIDEQEQSYSVGDEQLLIHSVKVPVCHDDGSCDGILCIFWDITEHKLAENRLRQSATVFENTADGVIVTDLNSRIIAVNKAFCEISGYSEDEALGKKTSFRRSERQDTAFYESMWRSLKANGRWQGEIWNRRKSGEVYPEWMTISVVRDNSGRVTNYVAVFSDISQVKRSQMQLDHMANHDPLTDLPNRTLLDDRLKQAINRAARQGTELAVLFIDLDRFKNVNDTLGHPSGDQVLQEVARRLKTLLRGHDTVARQGGDEFIILIEDFSEPEIAETVADKVIEAVSQPLHIRDKEFFIGASIGISIYPEDGIDAASLIKHADAAMYRAKEHGRNTWQFYTRELTEHASERLQLEAGLRRALERKEFELFYQPKVDLRDGRILAAEALLRWTHPELGFVPPDKFISIAEDNGLILPIGEWVLRDACRSTAQWVRDYPDFQHMAVNISGVQIQRDDMVALTEAVLHEYGLAASQLQLEITESVLMQYPQRATDVLEGLRDRGICLAVDDFGTGYSSLSYLKKFPIHTLKIDRSFVQDIPHDSNDTAITRAIIALGKSLQLRIVAEGVETAEQGQFLQAEGCDYGQGYFYSRPVPAAEFERLLKAGRLPLAPEQES